VLEFPRSVSYGFMIGNSCKKHNRTDRLNFSDAKRYEGCYKRSSCLLFTELPRRRGLLGNSEGIEEGQGI
jgi:hypothetical protein